MSRKKQLEEIVELVRELSPYISLTNDFSGGVDGAINTFIAGLEVAFDKNGKIDLKKAKRKLELYKENLPRYYK